MSKKDLPTQIDKDKLIEEINLNLNQISKGKVEGITKTLKLIDQFFRLHQSGGLITANFFNDAIIKTNSFESLDFTEKKDTNNNKHKAKSTTRINHNSNKCTTNNTFTVEKN